eukprot:4494596-Pleurochrysis_carterae.AAC.1
MSPVFNTDDIFLDVIERVRAAVSASSASEARAVENFKALQLRMRDGLMTEEDYETLIKPLDLMGLPEEKQASLLEVSTTRLMTTRAKRDATNHQQMMVSVANGGAFLTPRAINSNSIIAGVDEDQVEYLSNLLTLPVGAHVLITHNTAKDLSILNGTPGSVHNILVGEDGLAVAVLVPVKRRTATADGYSGPSFLDTGEDLPDNFNLATHAVIAVAHRQSEMAHRQGISTRQQFPIMLAWAVTVHKS